MDVMRVSNKSSVAKVAGSIAGTIRDHGQAEVQAIGAGAVNQAVKAIAIARGYLHDDGEGVDLIFTPEFVDIELGGVGRTAIKFKLEGRQINATSLWQKLSQKFV